MEEKSTIEQLSAIGFNVLIMWIVATLSMLVYSFRSNRDGFDFKCWLKTNVNRFIVGAILIVGLGTLTVISPDIDAMLQLFGFNTGKTPVALGLAIGVFLIAGVSGNPAEIKEK